jgi:hypothetical protein
MWHEVALTGMGTICIRSKVDMQEALRGSALAYVSAGQNGHYFAARGDEHGTASWLR